MRKAAAIKPSIGLGFRAASAFDSVPRDSGAIRESRERLSRFLDHALDDPRTKGAVSNPILEIGQSNFALAYHDLTNAELATRIAAFHLGTCPALAWSAPHCAGPAARRRRIRVLIISNSLGLHTIGKLFGRLPALLPRDRFEVVVASENKSSDPYWLHQMAGADHQVILSHDLFDARRQLASVEADIVFYPDIGMHPFTYFLSFARLAPVQVVSVGHPDTTGVPTIDYYLTSRGAEPPDWREHYTERAILLDEFPFHYMRPDDIQGRLSRADLGLPAGATLYVCPQTLFKLHPDRDHAFIDILRRDPKGLVVLIRSGLDTETRNLRNRLAAAGPDVIDRVIFQPRMNALEFLSLLSLADLMIEPFAFSGGNTIYEALSTGTPILAYRGRHMRSRVAGDLLTMAGLGRYVESEPGPYVDAAVGLANDPDRRSEARRRFREGIPNLYERPGAVSGLATFLEAAVDAHRRGDRLEAGPFG